MARNNGFELHHDPNCDPIDSGFHSKEGQWVEVGIFPPGTRHPGRAPCKLLIRVTEGELWINRKRYFPQGETCVIKAGVDIEIEVKKVSRYTCRYCK